MIKEVRSWSKPHINNLIGRKKVDWSVFEYGTQIPTEFHEDFAIANANHFLKVGEKIEIEIIIDGKSYNAQLIHFKRKDSDKGSLQLRYDQNNSLKELLKKAFSISYQYFLENRDEKTKKPVFTPKEQEEFIEFYETGKPFVYDVVLNNRKLHSNISFWWVNQGQTYRQEKEEGILWAPQKSKQGIALPHHVGLVKPKVGDIVFCYSAMEVRSVGVVKKEAVEAQKPKAIAEHNWEEDGYLVELEYNDLEPSIKKDDIPVEWRLEEGGPFDRNGNLKQGYFFELSNDFAKKLFNLYGERFPSEVRVKMVEYKSGNGNTQVAEGVSPRYLPYNEIINHIHSYITSKGFYYKKEEVTNLFLSLKSKPFVILSGISGTGKTKMVQWFAESLGATEKNGQFTLIPIRPDWNDGSDLLGYKDIKGEYIQGPLTKVILTAEENPDLPYFVLLDEMNLARVEYYFSDILSVMESRKWEEGKISSSTLISENLVERDIPLPNNLYIIGTVNMDETTHPFSKKVLDRANTIEFNRVELGNLLFLKDLKEVLPITVGDKQLASKYLHLKDLYETNASLVERVTNELVKINEVLQLIHAHVGYRVRDEICFYMAYNEEGGLMTFNEALDYCILQKILPRISGSDDRVEKILKDLFKIFTNKEYLSEIEIDLERTQYPNSAKKVVEMLRRLGEDGFTSFWIS
ncbi:McrB family protein [Cytobacillus sp. FJAT-54145]|uniref:McrB family protein n=1 Tax=Cytobacillus spartinae TaxID=3299023 RepID=A0ABW6KAL4_9BACI